MSYIHVSVPEGDRASVREILEQNPEITSTGGGKAKSGTFYVEEDDFPKLQYLCQKEDILITTP